MHILYYVTSHGFGHAVRSAAICNALGACCGDVEITIKSDVGAKFFAEELNVRHNVLRGGFDVGCLQSDGVTVHVEKTLATYEEIAARNKKLLDDEAQFCRENKIDCIVSDITPFAFDVAERAHIPSVAISNFTWHDIYAPYVSRFPKYEKMLSEIANQYNKATLALALYPAFPMEQFTRKISVPTVCQKGKNQRREIFERFNIDTDENKKLGVIYVGNFGLDSVNWRELESMSDWEFVGVYPLADSPKNFHLVSKDEFRYQDLSASADAIIAKMGYGVFSESLAYRIPIVYPPRIDFAEFNILDSEAQRIFTGHAVSADVFTSVKWKHVLDEAIRNREKIAVANADGARVCAEEIIKVAAKN